MKIVVFEAQPCEAAAFEPLRSGNDLVLVPERLDAANAAAFADAAAVSTFIYSSLGAETLRHLPSLKLIATRSTGFNHIDLRFCAERGIRVANVPSYGENTVAEHVFALLLAISHRLPEAIERAQHGRFSPEGLEGFDLAGRTMGIVGTGNIGHHVARIARGFEMNVLAYDIAPDPALAAALSFLYVPFEELLASSDVVSLHVPARPDTRRLLDAEAFARMKQGVVVINTARGEVIDTMALIQALAGGKVAAAGLDVLPEEPAIREEAELISPAFFTRRNVADVLANHVLLRMRNVIVTPHSAFNTREATQRILETTVENIEAFAAGRPLNLVTGPEAPALAR